MPYPYLTLTEVDKTGKSYYGETGLFFMTLEGKVSNAAPLVEDRHLLYRCGAPPVEDRMAALAAMAALYCAGRSSPLRPPC